MCSCVNKVSFKNDLNPYAPVYTNTPQTSQKTEPYPADKFETKDDSSKKKKIAISALSVAAAVGVLSAADILFFKGKHINKLTGKNKVLEDALSRATKAENNAAEAESKIKELKKTIEEFIDTKPQTRLHETGNGSLTLDWMQRVYSDPPCEEMQREIDKLMNMTGYKFSDYTKELAGHFEIVTANGVKEAITTKPIIIDKKTGQVIKEGIHVVPMAK